MLEKDTVSFYYSLIESHIRKGHKILGSRDRAQTKLSRYVNSKAFVGVEA